MKRTLGARIASIVGVAALAAGMTVALTGVASADSASDSRATFHNEDNATTCADVGFDGSTQIGEDDNNSAADSNVSGEVTTNAGSVQPGTGEELNVTLLSSFIAIDAVVVKGGNGYNVYENPTFLPPTLGPPQHYIAPLTGGNKVPALSHWFVCYHETGSLEISKTLLSPVDPTAVVASSFDVHVACTSGSFDVSVAEGTPTTIPGLPDGDVCVVTETSVLPAGAGTPVYDPATASTDGVAIAVGTTVTVGITNDFTQVAGISAARPVSAAPAFTG